MRLVFFFYEKNTITICRFIIGRKIYNDIQNAVRLYKELSCFDNIHAKNNLGVIYKNGFNKIKQSIGLANEYFNEAIRKNDILSMYNLSNLLLDENEDSYSKPIELLIESSSQKFVPSLILLCFLLFQKCESLNYWMKELESHNKKLNALIKDISHIWSYMKLLISNKKVFFEKYHKFREMDFVYIYHEVKPLKNLKFEREISKLTDINADFYEGFNIYI